MATSKLIALGVALEATGVAITGPDRIGQILTFAGVVIVAAISAYGAYQARQVHTLVNSESQRARRVNERQLREIAALHRVISKLTGTPEDAMKAIIAEAKAEVPLIDVSIEAESK